VWFQGPTAELLDSKDLPARAFNPNITLTLKYTLPLINVKLDKTSCQITQVESV